MDELITNCLALKVGAKIGSLNLSVIAYCDDVILMGNISSHMNLLLQECAEYAHKWKIEFNSSKSEALTIGDKSPSYIFKLNNVNIPNVQSIIYLGMPIGHQSFIDKFYRDKFSKTEKSVYSLRSLGCRPLQPNPHSVAFLYKTYCQSI